MHRFAFPPLHASPLREALRSLSCHDEIIPAGTVFPQRAIDQSSLQVTLSGEADILVGGQARRHAAGRLCALARGARLYERAATRWHVRYVMLSGPWLAALEARLAADAGGIILPRPPRPWIAALNDAIDAGLAAGPTSAWRIAAALATVIGGLVADPGTGDLLAEVGALVDAAPERAWRTAELCGALRLRPRTLQQRFQRLAGESPARWILRRRLAHAEVLLRRGEAVTEVARRLGFADAFHFSRVFKRLHGTPPSRLRS